MSHRPRRGLTTLATIGVALLALGGLVGAVAGVHVPGAGAATPTYVVPPSGGLTVTAKGNGHGHGLSQYGADGAAQAGLSARQILAFYYPGTSITTLGASTIRVLLSNTGSTTVVAPAAGLTVTGVGGTLATNGVSRYRLIAGSGSSLTLQKLVSGTWSTVAGGLANGAAFNSSAGSVLVYLADGTSTRYDGSIRALNAGGSVNTVNVVSLDDYAKGVAPRESPASWPAAAVSAQAVAARTYGRFEVVNTPSGSGWDICDTSSCQVYGGAVHYDSAGNVLWTDDAAAIASNANQVLTYGGQPIFAQYSASNGGWTVDGGQPYLQAKADPYDTAAVDPYFSYTQSASVSSLAGYYGLQQVTQIQINSRDGNGTWGGRVVSATVIGTTSGGAPTSVSTTGYSLASALGLGTTWFTFPQSTPTAPTKLAVQAYDGAAHVTWEAPASAGTSPITQYVISVGGKQVTAAPTDRSGWVTGLVNGTKYTVSLQAQSAVGLGPAVSATVTPVAHPDNIKPVPPLRLYDTRTSGTVVTPSSPFLFGVLGHGSIPVAGVTAVTLDVTVVNPSASGSLRVVSHAAQPVSTAAIAYRGGQSVTATVTVPMTLSSFVEFIPSAGSVSLVIDQEGYSTASGGRITPLSTPMLVANSAAATTSSAGEVVGVRGHTGIPAGVTAALLNVKAVSSSGVGWVTLWPDGTALPGIHQVSVTSAKVGTNLVLVPVGSSGNLRMAANSPGIAVQATLVGYVTAGAGSQLETLTPAAVADSTAGGTSLQVTPAGTSLRVAGVAGVPANGVSAVLLQLTGSGVNATLYAYGAAKTVGGGMALSSAESSTATVLVPLVGSSVNLATSAGPASVAVDVIGYLPSG